MQAPLTQHREGTSFEMAPATPSSPASPSKKGNMTLEEDNPFCMKLRRDVLKAMRDQHQILQDWALRSEQRNAQRLEDGMRAIRGDIRALMQERQQPQQPAACQEQPQQQQTLRCAGPPGAAAASPERPLGSEELVAAVEAGIAKHLQEGIKSIRSDILLVIQDQRQVQKEYARKPEDSAKKLDDCIQLLKDQRRPLGFGEHLAKGADPEAAKGVQPGQGPTSLAKMYGRAAMKVAAVEAVEGEGVSNVQETLTFKERVNRASLVAQTMVPKMEASPEDVPSQNKNEKTPEQLFKMKMMKRKRINEQESENAKGWLVKFCDSLAFKVLTAVAVMANAVFTGVEVDMDMQYALMDPPQAIPNAFDVWDKAFAGFFLFELTARILAYKKEFFFGYGWAWNLADMFLVLTQVLEMVFSNANMSSLRIMRMLRLVRTLRIIRVITFFRSLRMMVCCVLNSVMSLVWAAVMLLLVMYLFSIIFLQGTSMYLREMPPMDVLVAQNEAGLTPETSGDGLTDLELRDALSVSYPGMVRTLMTMLMAITGGMDWYDCVQPLMNVSPWYAVVFSFYTLFVLFGVLNVLAAVFVDHALQISDRDILIQAEIARNQTFMEDMQELFLEADSEVSDVMTKDELCRYLANDRVSAYMAVHGLDVSDVSNMFELLDSDSSGNVELHEFVLGTARLKGHARCLDVMRVFQCMDVLQEHILRVHKRLDAVGAPATKKLSVT